MTRHQIRNYGRAFDIFKDRQLGRVPTFFMRVGAVLLTMYFIAELAYTTLRWLQFDVTIWWIQGTITLLGVTGFLGGLLMLGVVSIYYIGSQQNMRSFLPALGFVLKKVALYIILPAIALMIIVPVVVIAVYSIAKLLGA